MASIASIAILLYIVSSLDGMVQYFRGLHPVVLNNGPAYINTKHTVVCTIISDIELVN